jgi:hypothetical protein
MSLSVKKYCIPKLRNLYLYIFVGLEVIHIKIARKREFTTHFAETKCWLSCRQSDIPTTTWQH